MADNPFSLVPDVEFFEVDPDKMVAEMVADYEAAMTGATGKPFTLPVASKEYIFIQAQVLRIAQWVTLANQMCKMNLLKYAVGHYLDQFLVIFGVWRLAPAKAVTRQRFTLSAVQSNAIAIPVGTRVSTEDATFFQTTHALVIPAGETSGITSVEAVAEGSGGNGYAPGEVNVLVDPIPFVSETANVEVTQGGSDTEDDDNLRLRGYYKLQSYSTAGPADAYQYHVRAYNQAIEDVEVANPEPGVVEITITLTVGESPGDAFVEGLLAYLEDGKRPMTDEVRIIGPEEVPYNMTVTYYVARSNQALQSVIEGDAHAAFAAYLEWQDGKIGRDLNPDQLVSMMMGAGVKRTKIEGVSFTPILSRQVCRFAGDMGAALVFGGIEDD